MAEGRELDEEGPRHFSACMFPFANLKVVEWPNCNSLSRSSYTPARFVVPRFQLSARDYRLVLDCYILCQGVRLEQAMVTLSL